MTAAAYSPARYNNVVEVEFRAGWIGLFAGESQTKALERALDRLNAQGLRVRLVVVDRWSFGKRLLWALILIVTLGFVGRVPNVLIITEPIPMAREPVPRRSLPAESRESPRSSGGQGAAPAAQETRRSPQVVTREPMRREARALDAPRRRAQPRRRPEE